MWKLEDTTTKGRKDIERQRRGKTDTETFIWARNRDDSSDAKMLVSHVSSFLAGAQPFPDFFSMVLNLHKSQRQEHWRFL